MFLEESDFADGKENDHLREDAAGLGSAGGLGGTGGSSRARMLAQQRDIQVTAGADLILFVLIRACVCS
jgi:hypothetical protein